MEQENKEFTNGIIYNEASSISFSKVQDTYSNVRANLGFGSSNLSETANYVMERFSWNYQLLNVLFRNNWIAKAIVEKPANEMLKNGFQIQSQISPDKIDKIMHTYNKTRTGKNFLDCLKWARLYGGCILVPMIAGQEDLSQELNYDEIDVDAYKGCFIVDRWCGISPSVEVVEDIESTDFGKPKYYDITNEALNKTYRIHTSRLIKLIGRELPYWEQIAENYWGASELEHVFTELKKRDDTSSNISFLIFLANIRVFKMKGLSRMLSIGDQEAAAKVYDTMASMNRLMCNTGTLVVDQDEDFSEHQYTFSGINEIYESFMLDIAGAAEIPVDKLFGRTPSGFNGGAESLQNYYDMIQEKQETQIKAPLEKLIKIITMSSIGEIPDDLEISFNPVRRPADLEKADLAQKNAQPIFDAYGANLIDKATALSELKQQSPVAGIWSNITDEMIDKAKNEAANEEQEQKQDEEELMSFARGDGNEQETQNEKTLPNDAKKFIGNRN